MENESILITSDYQNIAFYILNERQTKGAKREINSAEIAEHFNISEADASSNLSYLLHIKHVLKLGNNGYLLKDNVTEEDIRNIHKPSAWYGKEAAKAQA